MIRRPRTITPPRAPRGLRLVNCHVEAIRTAMRLGDPLLLIVRSPHGATSTWSLRIVLYWGWAIGRACLSLVVSVGGGRPSVADARVEEGVEGVDEQVHEHHHAHDQQVHAPVSYTHLRAHETPEHLVC